MSCEDEKLEDLSEEELRAHGLRHGARTARAALETLIHSGIDRDALFAESDMERGKLLRLAAVYDPKFGGSLTEEVGNALKRIAEGDIKADV